jgi:hypothetical protein
MSVVQNIFPNRILQKLRLLKECIYREFNNEEKKIFFDYKIHLKHPFFKAILDTPPLKYSNYKPSKLLHLISGPNREMFDNKNFIIEPVNHVCSVLAPYLGRTLKASEYVENIEIAKNVYSSKRCKKKI